jgi:pullulanase
MERQFAKLSMNPTRKLMVLVLLAAVLRVDGALFAVQVDTAMEPVQQNSGCTSGTASYCDLRMYEVMVESFVDGDPNHDYNAGYGTSHHKGDIRGVIDSLDYIKSLGLNAVWLTPIFDSHAGEPFAGGGVNLKLDATGYYTRDYFSIDPKFGTLADAQELVNTAHEKGMYVFFDGVFGHDKGNLVPSPTGKLPAESSPGVADYRSPATVDFYKEVATYWINELGIDGWRLDQSYQVPPSAWRQIRTAVEDASAQRAQAGEQWGTLGYMVAEDWSDASTIENRTYGTDANPILNSAFDFPVRYAVVGVLAGEESGLSGRPASVISQNWAYGAHDNIYADHALPNLMLGNHDLVRFGDLLQRAGIANPDEPEYWARHRLAFMFQAAYSGPITRYYGEEIGDEVPNYADQVTNNCANQGLCDDHVARTSAKILGVTVDEQDLSPDALQLMQFHQQLMAARVEYPALSHGTRQNIYSDDDLYVDLKTYDNQQIVFAMNVSDQTLEVQLSQSLFNSLPLGAWDILNSSGLSFSDGYLDLVLPPLSGSYVLLLGAPVTLLGDYNQDGVVDAADYTTWRDVVETGSTTLPNDPTPGTVDQSDFEYWRAHFGETVGGASATGGSAFVAVPEPATLGLCSVATIGLGFLRQLCATSRSPSH